MQLPEYSMGIGDRFARQGVAQLQSFIQAKTAGLDITPVWNKSNREHLTVNTTPDSVRREADAAVMNTGWAHPYFVDADHINLTTVDRYIESADFFTIDVGDAIGGAVVPSEIEAFIARHHDALRALDLSGLNIESCIDTDALATFARKYLPAVKLAATTYRHIAKARDGAGFIVEVSMDETDTPQSPQEIFLILAALADEKVPLQTIAPKFSGRFNKGVDYAGDLSRFAIEFEADVLAVAAAVKAFGLPDALKLSIHSGSDKFSIYGAVADVLGRHKAGVHIKTAGTTWLAEVEGLITAGGEGLDFARELYIDALAHFDDLCTPYAAVLNIRRTALPAAASVSAWTAVDFRDALLHDPRCPRYNPDLRQFIHVAYKMAAGKGTHYLDMLDRHAAVIGQRVTENIGHHISLLFGAIQRQPQAPSRRDAHRRTV